MSRARLNFQQAIELTHAKGTDQRKACLDFITGLDINKTKEQCRILPDALIAVAKKCRQEWNLK